MKLIIDIPKEFENDFNVTKFEDLINKVRGDLHKFYARLDEYGMISDNEVQTINMLQIAFRNSKLLPKGHGDLVDRNELLKFTQKAVIYDVLEERNTEILGDFIPAGYVRGLTSIIEADTKE